MASFGEALANGLGAAACNVLRANPLRAAPGPVGDFYNHWYRNACNREPDPPPNPPFNGGQCEGVQYDVYARIREATNGGDTRIGETSIRVFGPIDSIRITESCDTPRNSLVVKARNGALGEVEQVATLAAFGCRNDPGQTFYQNQFEILNLNVTRVDGLPDVCGNPPPPPPPPPQPIQIGPFNITYNNNEGDDVDINVGPFIVGPPIIVNNDFEIPIGLTYNNPEFNFPVNLNVRLRYEPDGNGGRRPVIEPDNPSTRGNPGRDGRDGNDGENPEDYRTPEYTEPDPTNPEEEEPPENECPEVERPRQNLPLVIKGVVVTVLSEGVRASKIISPSGSTAPIFVPAVGWIRFRVPINNFQTALTSDIPVKNARNLIPVPWDGGASSWEFIPNGTGVNVSIVPIFRTSELQGRQPDEAEECS